MVSLESDYFPTASSGDATEIVLGLWASLCTGNYLDSWSSLGSLGSDPISYSTIICLDSLMVS